MNKERGLPSLEDESIEVCITDPPYGISYYSNYYKEDNPVGKIQNDDKILIEWIREISRILYKNSALFMFSRWDVYPFFLEEIKKYFEYKNLLLWVKNNWSAGDLKGNFGNQYEVIIFATKGRYILKGNRHANVFFAKRINPTKYSHPTIKPVKLIKDILLATRPDSVIDPFMGSGTTGYASNILGIKWMGYEINKEYKKQNEKRFNQSTIQKFL